MIGKQDIQQIVDAVADRIGNGGSKLDTRLSKIETVVAVINDRFDHLPCKDVKNISDDVAALKAKASIWFPILSAIIGGVVVGSILIIVRYFVK